MQCICPDPPLRHHTPAQARDFMHQCFNRVPRDRPNATRLLKHPWLENVQLPAARAATNAAASAAAAAAAAASFGAGNGASSTAPALGFSRGMNVGGGGAVAMPGLWSPPSPIKEEPSEGPLQPAPVSAAAGGASEAMSPMTATSAAPRKLQMPPSEQASVVAPAAPIATQALAVASGAGFRPPPSIVTTTAALEVAAVAVPPSSSAAALGPQYDTIVSPSQLPEGLKAAGIPPPAASLHAATTAAAAPGRPAPTGVMLDPEAEVDRQLMHLALYGSVSEPSIPGGSGGGCALHG